MSIGRGVAAHPGLGVAMHGVGHDHEELLVIELGHREVGFERTVVIEPLRISDPARRPIDVIGRDMIEHAAGVPARDPELAHERRVHEDHALARGAMLGLPPRKPVLPAP